MTSAQEHHTMEHATHREFHFDIQGNPNQNLEFGLAFNLKDCEQTAKK